MTDVHHRYITTLAVGKRPSSGENWDSFKILFHGFPHLPSARGQFTRSPEFTCNGHQWCLCIYPGGCGQASAGYSSGYIEHCSEGNVTSSYEMSVRDKWEKGVNICWSSGQNFIDKARWGWKDFCPRAIILANHLDDEGTLAIVVSMKREVASPFVPSNPMNGMITRMFLNEETADVCFEVSDVDANEGNRGEAVSSTVTFHAHSFILKACAPLLASLFGSEDDGIVTVSITDVKPAIFRHMLHYVYGGSVPDGEMKIHAKALISAANKYSIVNLKLGAEAAYVESTVITMDNAIENLLFADRLSLALLKEAVMDFLAEHHVEASRSLSFPDIPCDVVKDLLVAFGRKTRAGTNAGSDDDLSTVSELRLKLAALGLDVDGSREAMIEALRANAHESADAEEDDDSHGDDNHDVDLLEEE